METSGLAMTNTIRYEDSLMDSEFPTPDQENPPHQDNLELVNLRSEIEELKDKYLRVVAEMENLRRRHEKDRSEQLKFGQERFLTDLLAVLDGLENFKKSETSDSSQTNLKEGFGLIEKLLWTTLMKHGLRVIETADGKFDPQRHQAIQRVDDPTATEERIGQVFQTGYLLHERLLRPAIVSVIVPAAE